MDRTEALDHIEERLLALRTTLSKKSVTCECCGHARYEHWNQKQARDSINAAINRVRKVKDMAERGVLEVESCTAVRSP